MASDLLSVFVHDRPFIGFEPAPLEERAVVVARQEARLLALSAPRGCKTCTFSLGARLGLGLRTERK